MTKKNGLLRLCIDNVKLNKNTYKNAYPLTNISDTSDQLSESTYFLVLEMKSGYWQIGHDPNDPENPHLLFFLDYSNLMFFHLV